MTLTMKHITKVARRGLFALAFVTSVGASGSAQSVAPRVTARVEPDSVMIGDRFTITIEVEKDLVQSIAFPTFTPPQSDESADTKGARSSMECIVESPIDTLSAVGRRLHLRKRYEMAAFDEGIYSIGRPQVLYADKNIVDTLYAPDSLRVVVGTFQIDSTSHAIFDMKPQKTLPFRFGEVSGYLLWALAVAAVLALLIFALVKWLARRGKHISDLWRPAPPLPPHIVAITALEQLHNQKLWQNNRHKQYYSALSDILRTYLAGRFDVGAMEMTTDEIVDAMRDVELPQKSAMDLVAVLRDADLVKFAKAMPEADENEAAYNKAYYFVEETKPVEEMPETDEAGVPTTNEVK